MASLFGMIMSLSRDLSAFSGVWVSRGNGGSTSTIKRSFQCPLECEGEEEGSVGWACGGAWCGWLYLLTHTVKIPTFACVCVCLCTSPAHFKTGGSDLRISTLNTWICLPPYMDSCSC